MSTQTNFTEAINTSKIVTENKSNEGTIPTSTTENDRSLVSSFATMNVATTPTVNLGELQTMMDNLSKRQNNILHGKFEQPTSSKSFLETLNIPVTPPNSMKQAMQIINSGGTAGIFEPLNQATPIYSTMPKLPENSFTLEGFDSIRRVIDAGDVKSLKGKKTSSNEIAIPGLKDILSTLYNTEQQRIVHLASNPNFSDIQKFFQCDTLSVMEFFLRDLSNKNEILYSFLSLIKQAIILTFSKSKLKIDQLPTEQVFSHFYPIGLRIDMVKHVGEEFITYIEKRAEEKIGMKVAINLEAQKTKVIFGILKDIANAQPESVFGTILHAFINMVKLWRKNKKDDKQSYKKYNQYEDFQRDIANFALLKTR